MSINFDALPSKSPNYVAPAGKYKATINKAEVRIGKTSGKPYINMELSLTDPSGKSFGKMFDIITESDSDIARYKLRRLITALEIPMTGNFELKDLCKIIPNKQLLVDVIEEPAKDGHPAKAVVDVFTNEIFYSIVQAKKGETPVMSDPISDDDLPFAASDAEDATPASDPTDY